MWVLSYYNKAMCDWYEMKTGATEQEMRDVLQIWIDDEYYTRDINSFYERDMGDGLILINIDDEIFGIWEGV